MGRYERLLAEIRDEIVKAQVQRKASFRAEVRQHVRDYCEEKGFNCKFPLLTHDSVIEVMSGSALEISEPPPVDASARFAEQNITTEDLTADREALGALCRVLAVRLWDMLASNLPRCQSVQDVALSSKFVLLRRGPNDEWSLRRTNDLYSNHVVARRRDSINEDPTLELRDFLGLGSLFVCRSLARGRVTWTSPSPFSALLVVCPTSQPTFQFERDPRTGVGCRANASTILSSPLWTAWSSRSSALSRWILTTLARIRRRFNGVAPGRCIAS